MKRILLFLSMLLCLSAGIFAQNYNSQDMCEGPNGRNDTIPNPPDSQEPLSGTETSGGISADPNEIIGPMGYDSIH